MVMQGDSINAIKRAVSSKGKFNSIIKAGFFLEFAIRISFFQLD